MITIFIFLSKNLIEISDLGLRIVDLRKKIFLFLILNLEPCALSLFCPASGIENPASLLNPKSTIPNPQSKDPQLGTRNTERAVDIDAVFL